MTNVKFFGLDNEQANIRLTRGGASDSFSTTWSSSSKPNTDHVFQVSPQGAIANVGGIGGNSEDDFGSYLAIHRPSPSRQCLIQTVKARGGDDLILGDYSSFDTLGNGFFNGAPIQLWGFNSANEWTKLRETTVVDHRARDWRNRATTDQLSWTVELQSWFLVNRDYWFGVRKLSATGDHGVTAYGMSSTVEGDSGFSGTSSTDTNFTETGVYDGALTAPTGFSLNKVSGERAVTLSWNDDGHLATGGQFEIVVMYYNPITREDDGIELAPGGGVPVKAGMAMLVQQTAELDDRNLCSPRTGGLTGVAWGMNPYHPKGSRQGSDGTNGFYNGQAPNGSTWRTIRKADYLGVPYLDTDCPWYYQLDLKTGDVFKIFGWEYGDSTSTNYPFPKIGETYKSTLVAAVSTTTEARFIKDNQGLACQLVRFNGNTVNHDLSSPFIFNLDPNTDTYEFEVEWSEDTGAPAIGKLGIELYTEAVYDLGSWKCWNTEDGEDTLTRDEKRIFDYLNRPFIRPHQTTKTASKPYTIEQLITGPKYDLNGYPLHSMLKWTAEQLDRQAENGNPAPERAFWQQLDIPFDPEDADGIKFWMNYVFGAAGSGAGADLRVALGRTTPWSDSFDKIFLEFFNEMWNTLPAFFRTFATVNYDTGEDMNLAYMAGAMCQKIWDVIKATPEWSVAQDKLVWIGGGWINNKFGGRFAEFAPDCKIITEAFYHAASWEQGGSATDDGPDGYGAQVAWAATESERSIANAISNLGVVNAARVAAGNPTVSVSIYEMGPTVSTLSGVPASERRQAQSVAAGATCIAQTLNQFRSGFGPICFFKDHRGSIWSIGQEAAIGDQFNAQAHWMALWNTRCAGGTLRKVLRVDSTTSTHNINGRDYTFNDMDAWWADGLDGKSYLWIKSYLMPKNAIDSSSQFYDANDDGVRTVTIRQPADRTITSFKRHFITAGGQEGVYNAHNKDPAEVNYADIAMNEETLTVPGGIDISLSIGPVDMQCFEIEYEDA